jgi:hypothetical protein
MEITHSVWVRPLRILECATLIENFVIRPNIKILSLAREVVLDVGIPIILFRIHILENVNE